MGTILFALYVIFQTTVTIFFAIKVYTWFQKQEQPIRDVRFRKTAPMSAREHREEFKKMRQEVSLDSGLGALKAMYKYPEAAVLMPNEGGWVQKKLYKVMPFVYGAIKKIKEV